MPNNVSILATGSTFVPQAISSSQGSVFGNTPSEPVDGTPLDCNAQVMSASESEEFDTRGERRRWEIFFATDPAVNPNTRGKITKWQSQVLPEPYTVRVLTTEIEGSPDGSLLMYILICEEIDTRGLG